jgi:hypothetical protein
MGVPVSKTGGKKNLNEATILEANLLASVMYENTGSNFEFISHKLPPDLQFSSLEAAALIDLKNKSDTRVMLGGNFYGDNIEMGRSDASYGNIMAIDKTNNIKTYPLGELSIKGQIRKIATIQIDSNNCFLIARNDLPLVVIKPLID